MKHVSGGVITDRQLLTFEGDAIPVFCARPLRDPPLTVMVFSAIWSVTPHIEDLCQRLAEEGYGALAPCMFRQRGIPSRAASADALAQTFLGFDDRRCVRDLRRISHGALQGEFGFYPGPLVAMGFCLGGRFAHYLGALDKDVTAVINFYGRLRFERQVIKPFLPAEVTGLIEVPYLGHFAESDAMIPLSDVLELQTDLRARHVRHDIHIYKGARHGFVDPERPTEHNPQAAALAWQRTMNFIQGLLLQ